MSEEKNEKQDSKEQAPEKKADGKKCRVKGCKRPYRAKGYCTAHYHKWRRGELPKARYKTCNYNAKKRKRGEKKECLKPVFRHGLCEAHYKAYLGQTGEQSASS